MLDRLISGAGALADRADRIVRALARGGGADILNHRPGSVVVIIALLGASIAFGFVALEATDNPTPQAVAPEQVAVSHDFGRRVYATISGFLSDAYVETYADENVNGTQDEGEDGEAWFYFLLDEGGTTGVTVRSTRPPAELMRYEATGVLVRDPEYLAEDLAAFPAVAGVLGTRLVLDEDMLVDTTLPGSGQPVALDLAQPLPADGTYVSVSGETLGYLDVCAEDTDGDGSCVGEETVAFDVFLGDRASGRAITLYRDEIPRLGPFDFTGMLRREPASIGEAKTADGLDFDSLGISVSDHYLLDDGATPASAAPSVAVSIGAAVLAAVIAVGLAGGYLVFRRSRRHLPFGSLTLEPGEAIAVHVTGKLRRPEGLIHVREARGHLRRFVLQPPVEGPSEAAAAPPAPGVRTSPETTLIVERAGLPEGVALGRGELAELSSGRVMPLTGPRPALRVVTGTGPLLLSFDSTDERDRAAAELIAEAGLLIRDTGIAAR